ASTLVLGAVKVDGTTITINGSGVISSSLVTAGSSTVGAVQYNGTTQNHGMFDGGSTAPIHTDRLNYDGNLYVNELISITDSIINGLTVGLGPGAGFGSTVFGVSALNDNTTGGFN